MSYQLKECRSVLGGRSTCGWGEAENIFSRVVDITYDWAKYCLPSRWATANRFGFKLNYLSNANGEQRIFVRPRHFSTDGGSVAGTCWISDRDLQLAIRSSWLKTISKDIFLFGILQSSFCLSSREAKRPHLALLKSEQSKCEQDNPPPASFARRGGDITVNSNSRLEPHRSGLMIKRQRDCIATFVAQQTGSMVQC